MAYSQDHRLTQVILNERLGTSRLVVGLGRLSAVVHSLNGFLMVFIYYVVHQRLQLI